MDTVWDGPAEEKLFTFVAGRLDCDGTATDDHGDHISAVAYKRPEGCLSPLPSDMTLLAKTSLQFSTRIPLHRSYMNKRARWPQAVAVGRAVNGNAIW